MYYMKLKPNRAMMMLLVVHCFSSCCHGYWVKVQNTADTARMVKVIHVDSAEIQKRNFVYISNIYHPILFQSLGRKRLPITKDSIERSYSFVLPKGKKVFVAGGLGGPEYRKEQIVSSNDTIPMNGNKVTIRKEHWLIYTTSYTYSIK